MTPLFRLLLGSGGASSSILFSSLGLIAGDAFVVASGATVLMDIDTPALGYTDISGTVRPYSVNAPVVWTTLGITVNDGGRLEYGTAAAPCNGHSIVLNGAYVPLTMTTVAGFSTPTNPGTSRAIMVMPGGYCSLEGSCPATLWTTLNAHASAGASSLTLATSPGWLSTDPIIVAPTDFAEIATTELFTLASNTSGTTAALSGTLAAARWGVLQYPTDAGLSLTPGTFSTQKASAGVPTVLDERARVVNLRRGLTISAPNDTDWTNKGHGVVVMAMASLGLNQATLKVGGVQIRRGGQRGALGRYPLHFHLLSTNATTGAVTTDATQCYLKKCVVWDSENRSYTIHGTNGSEVSDNVGYNVKGHQYFMEDGVERRNVIDRNIALHTVSPNRGSSLPGSITSISGNGTTTTVNWTSHGLYSGSVVTVTGASISGFNVFRRVVSVVNANQFTYASTGNGTPTGCVFKYGNDRIKIHDTLAAGFWITNMDNKNRDNYGADSTAEDYTGNEGFGEGAPGMWISTATQAFGLSANVSINPRVVAIDTFSGFTGHSNKGQGLLFAGEVTDEAGTNLFGNNFGIAQGAGGAVSLSTGHFLWKNSNGGYRNNVAFPEYIGWTVADNGQWDFQGTTGLSSLSHDHLMVGNSFNNTNTVSAAQTYPRAGFIPYHGTLRFYDISAFNYPYAAVQYNISFDKGAGGGVHNGGGDFYDTPGIDLSDGLNTNIKYINSHPGTMVPPLHLDGRPKLAEDGTTPIRHYSIAMIRQDTAGKFGTAGKFMMPLTPATGLVDAYFLTGATNVADGPVTGTAVCKTTDTRFFGAGWSDGLQIDSDTTRADLGVYTPLTVTRQVPATGVTIGTPVVTLYGASRAFENFRAFAMQNGARFLVQFTDGSRSTSAPTTDLSFEIINANISGDFLLLGLPWANGSVARVCMGSNFTGESGSFANVADVTAGRATLVNVAAAGANAAAKIAAVLADTSGATYFQDTTANTIWVRYTAKPFAANRADSIGFPGVYDKQTVKVKV